MQTSYKIQTRKLSSKLQLSEFGSKRGFSQVHAYLPAMESFGFETDLRTHTSGQAPRVVAVDFEDGWTRTFRFGLCGWCSFFFFFGDDAVKKGEHSV